MRTYIFIIGKPVRFTGNTINIQESIDKSENNAYQIKDSLQIEFEVVKDNTDKPNKAYVTVYNLPDTIVQYLKDNLDNSLGGILEAGQDGNNVQVFAGAVEYMGDSWDRHTRKTKFIFGDAKQNLAYAKTNRSYRAGTSANKIISDLVSDMKLPIRNKKNAHKGSFGHLNVVAGCKKGAGIIAANAAFGFGAGLVSVVCHENLDLPYHIMQTHFISENCTAIAIGMGLGKYETDEIRKILNKKVPKIIDADLFYDKLICEVLEQEVVLTPHPKEFVSLLKLCDIADISVEELQNNRFLYVEKFCKKYPKVVLLLKGANVIISSN